MKPSKIFTLSVLLAAPLASEAATINIAMHNGGTTVNNMTIQAAGTVVNTSVDTWNNPANNGGVGLNFTGFALSDSTGTGTGATLNVNSSGSGFNNNGWGGQTQDWVMMEGWYALGAGNSFTVSNLPASFTSNGYTVTIYSDAGAARSMDFTIGGTTQTITGGAGSFSGTFNSDNTTVFTGLSGSGFTITGNAAAPASNINGVIIQSNPVPEPGTGLLGLLATGLLMARRRR